MLAKELMNPVTRTAHIVWGAAAVLVFHVFIISLWSDVWEAFLTLFLGVSGAYFLAIRRSRKRHRAGATFQGISKDERLGFSA
jgi:membrane protein implicated in regulation of membrane protease activity